MQPLSSLVRFREYLGRYLDDASLIQFGLSGLSAELKPAEALVRRIELLKTQMLLQTAQFLESQKTRRFRNCDLLSKMLSNLAQNVLRAGIPQ